jgi:hypothetical protein
MKDSSSVDRRKTSRNELIFYALIDGPHTNVATMCSNHKALVTEDLVFRILVK